MGLIQFLMRILVGGIFVYSGWSKLMVPVENFMAVIEGYQFLRPHAIELLATWLPWTELVFGAFLLLGFLTRASAAILGIFLAVFIYLISRSLWLHLPVSECGCFGSGIALAPWQALMLDSGLLLASIVLIIRPPQLWSLDRRLRK
ncbi:MAG: DoxX family protein [Candidatus Omnitrophica bacterium]|nr:DoxX family protein [Candidatus Omnitrophota bacterium]